MATRVGIMGFGRIGRNIFRTLHGRDDLQVAAIADLGTPEALEYLLRFDTVRGRFRGNIRSDAGNLYSEGRQIPVLSAKTPADVDWSAYDVDFVVESTGKYRTRESLNGHLNSGAKRVFLCSPPETAKDVDAIIVRGVNDDALLKEHQLISNGSCTINALAPVLKIVHENFGVEHAFMNSVHAYTNHMRLADVPHEDLRRSRAAAENIIPMDTYSPAAIGHVIPELEGGLSGMALNVPVPDGSAVDLTVILKRPVKPEELHGVLRSAAHTRLNGVLEFSDDPLVSSDVVGESHSAIVDGLATMVLEDMAKLVIWYDNGWAYSQRVVELMTRSIGGQA